MRQTSVLTLCCCFMTLLGNSQKDLKDKIESLTVGKNLKLGFALYDFKIDSTIAINGSDRYPMQSTFKFPIAVALLHEVDKGIYQLNDTMVLDKTDLYFDLWSPLGGKYPNGCSLPLSQIISYMVSLSDNSATDFILNHLSSAEKVQRILNTLGVVDIRIRNTEKEIQSSWNIQFDNWTTPMAMISFLQQFYHRELLSDPTHRFLWDVMAKTSTGSIRRYLPDSMTVAHKTGTSGKNKEGITAAQNDVGIMLLEDAHPVAFAIYITDSYESDEVNADLIANIAKMIYEHYAL